ncbi:gag/pol/env polyprotein, putative [Perkinsus marinus ATCC 50983]|uniref:Gag/pol/env polyprotein, putative n=1 Tax=Perkinsus marinus (strain ATCC 50983 / TXsc) TaxID=423536 RepID=C5K685_PERM5|nr:gag/pol/env polyprotein, putative [Perkinsus marinus ATCC 50983]EER20013.1 gag/pol/env polyprotein, putative [Perkinsus marinus ATCC 50983]|eukprot:XP_002788217.1 gag/pol/env polyprotein, putative [Perkinsus marinus ATCC 50983]
MLGFQLDMEIDCAKPSVADHSIQLGSAAALKEAESVNPFTAHVEVTRAHPPVRARYFSLPPEKREAATEVLQEALAKGWIEVVEDDDPMQWYSPTFLKKKPNGTYRILNDLREVNSRIHTYAPRTSLPDILGWKVLPQGLCTSPYFWENFVRGALNEIQLPPGVLVLTYADDITICAESTKSACRARDLIVEALRRHGVEIQPEKCQGPGGSVDFLGLQITREGWRARDEPVAKLRGLRAPRDRAELRSALGVIGYLKPVRPLGEGEAIQLT